MLALISSDIKFADGSLEANSFEADGALRSDPINTHAEIRPTAKTQLVLLKREALVIIFFIPHTKRYISLDVFLLVSLTLF